MDERRVEILKGNRALFARRIKTWTKEVENMREAIVEIDKELRALGKPDEEDLIGRQIDMFNVGVGDFRGCSCGLEMYGGGSVSREPRGTANGTSGGGVGCSEPDGR